ncbi:hypothetical protein V1264_004213 [Littorina saxatilis]|uniref:Uncharacterized protein n=1 Tax=Littorina saxatilis TaxID=31220 RepID=A0AAN9B145_9CAEN
MAAPRNWLLCCGMLWVTRTQGILFDSMMNSNGGGSQGPVGQNNMLGNQGNGQWMATNQMGQQNMNQWNQGGGANWMATYAATRATASP